MAEAATACFAPFALSLPEGAPATDSELVMGDNDVFETSDGGRLVFAPFEDKFWAVFRQALFEEFPALETRAYDDRVSRTLGKVEVGRILREVFGQRPLAWWSERLSVLDLPWTVLVETPEQLLAHPVAAARQLFEHTEELLGIDEGS